MNFDPAAYGEQVAALLALDGNGGRLMPLTLGKCSSEEARRRLGAASARTLFPRARAPEAALSGLWLYFSCLEESHQVSQNILTPEGSFWHGIMHRQEPDAGNSAYWFRRVGSHAIFAPLHEKAVAFSAQCSGASFQPGGRWDPFRFIDFCEEARRKPGSEMERLAREIQRAEWQLLFDYCARPER